MADTHSTAIRSYNMSRIRSKNTKPELLVRSYLFKAGFRFRLHAKYLPGHPDIILPKYKTVVFVHGCFWHSHKNCRNSVIPKSNVDYWVDKLKRNIDRDNEAIESLTSQGWKTIVVWECSLSKTNFAEAMDSLINDLKYNSI